MTVATRFTACSCLVLALFAAACGETPVSPTSTSGTGGSSGTASGAIITGTVSGMALASTSSTERATTAAAPRPVTVTVVGTNISAVIDGSSRFHLDNVPAGDVKLQFTATGLDATLTLVGVKAGDRIDIKVRVTDTSVRIEAEQRDRSNEGNDKDDSDFKGTVASLTGACPTLTFTMNGTTVKTNTATKFELACSRVANGTRLEVEGTRQGDGTVLATKVDRDD